MLPARLESFAPLTEMSWPMRISMFVAGSSPAAAAIALRRFT